MDDAEFFHWYGPWAPLSPPDVAELMAGIDVPWWIFGGWAIEAFTGKAREHEDVDFAFFAADLPAVLDRAPAGWNGSARNTGARPFVVPLWGSSA